MNPVVSFHQLGIVPNLLFLPSNSGTCLSDTVEYNSFSRAAASMTAQAKARAAMGAQATWILRFLNTLEAASKIGFEAFVSAVTFVAGGADNCQSAEQPILLAVRSGQWQGGSSINSLRLGGWKNSWNILSNHHNTCRNV